MFRSQQIITREYVCTSLKLLNYLKNTEFKILKIIPDARVVLCVRRTAPHGSPRIPATRFAATAPGMIFRILNSVFFKQFSNFNEVQTYSLMMIC